MTTQGVWINCLCHMWFARERGKIKGAKADIVRLLGCSDKEFAVFCSENKVHRFCDVTFRNNFVTLINRRMYKEEIARQGAKERVDRHRKRKCNEDVTGDVMPPSPSPIPPPVIKALQKLQKRFIIYKDIEQSYLAEIMEEFPNARAETVLGDLYAWELKNTKPTKNGALRLRNFFKTANSSNGQRPKKGVSQSDDLSHIGADFPEFD